MAKLGELTFRTCAGTPLAIAYRLPAADAEPLGDAWDAEADGMVVCPFVDHEDGLVFEMLCPYRVATAKVEDEYDTLATSQMTALLGTDGTDDEEGVGPLDAEVMQTFDLRELSPTLREHVAIALSDHLASEAVMSTREDTRLDRFRHPAFPDDVEVLLVSGGQSPFEEHVWATLEGPYHDDHVRDGLLFTATLLNEPGDDGSLGAGDTILVGLIAGSDDETPAGLLALPCDTEFGVTPTPEDYTRDADERVGGDLSLDIGATYFDEGMRSDGGHADECFREAERWYERSADMGNAQALCNLGYIHAYGRTGKVDLVRAASCFERAAGMGNAEACYRLADLLSSGKGMERDPERAMALYRKAYDIAKDDDYAAVRGSAALRLAEECERDVIANGGSHAQVLDLYVDAEMALEEAVEEGMGWYAGPLERARRGADRWASK